MKDTNQRLLLTVALCMAVALAWSFLFPTKAPPRQTQPTAQPPSQQQPAAAPTPGASAPAAPPSAPRETAVPRPPARMVQLDSERLHVVLNSEGAGVQSLLLKGEKFRKRKQGSNEPKQVDLVEQLPAGMPRPLSTVLKASAGADLLPADTPYEVLRHDQRSAVFRAVAGGVTLLKTITLDPQRYRLDLAVELRSQTAFAGQLAVLSTGRGEQGSSGSFFIGQTNTPAQTICKAGGKLERLAVGSTQGCFSSAPHQSVWEGPGPASFAGVDEQYFIRAVVPPEGSAATCHLEAKPDGALLASLSLPVSVAAGGTAAQSLLVYAGPKDTDELASVAPVLKESVDLGFWSVIANVLLAVMKFFYKTVPPHNWGVAIILLTVTVKILTFPLQHKSMKSMQEMQRLQPQIEEIKKKFAGDQQRQNVEQMKLFKEHGVNPMGSCLPMLIQMPVWLALYTTLQVSVELYNSVFIPGWLDDLTAKDPYYILPVAMGITMVLTQVLTPTPMSNPTQKYMGYAMSVFFSLLMLNLPSGLTLYIFVNNILSIIQQVYLRRAMRPPPASSQTLAVTARRA
jgi:YidC/Oxa1 family membrane protein insertase